MLSAAKVRMHGMQDENWIIKDKINQYRGLIKLYGEWIIAEKLTLLERPT